MENDFNIKEFFLIFGVVIILIFLSFLIIRFNFSNNSKFEENNQENIESIYENDSNINLGDNESLTDNVDLNSNTHSNNNTKPSENSNTQSNNNTKPSGNSNPSDKTKTIKITFNNKRASNGSGSMNNQVVSIGTTVKINELKYKNTGYIFRGWIMQRRNDGYYYGYDSNGNLGWYRNTSKWYYFDNQDDITDMVNLGCDLVMYADWTKQKDTYKIVYKNTMATNPSGIMKNQNVSVDFGSKLRKNEYKNGSAIFTGWVAKRESDNKIYGFNINNALGWYDYKDIKKYYYFKNSELIKNLVSAGDTVNMTAYYSDITSTSDITLYLSPNGNDTNSGTNNNRIKTLERAQEIIKEQTKIRNIKNVKILIASGIYYDQTIKWVYTNEGYNIIITAENTSNIPIFKCSGDNDRVWFSLSGDEVKNKDITLNLTISNIKVEGYFQAMSLIHGRGGTFKNIKVTNMYFSNIGTKYAYAQRIKNTGYISTYSPACIALGNIKNSTFSNNKFYNIENFPIQNNKYDFYIHALYIKTGSENNIVSNNDFKFISCDPIRLREGANYNEIYGNTFSKVGIYSYVNECYFPNGLNTNANIRNEVKSIGNNIYNNTFGYGYYYDDYLPYALIMVAEKDGSSKITILSRYSSLTEYEKKIWNNNASKVTVINASDSNSALYNEFKSHMWVHGNSFK